MFWTVQNDAVIEDFDCYSVVYVNLTYVSYKRATLAFSSDNSSSFRIKYPVQLLAQTPLLDLNVLAGGKYALSML